MNDAAPRTRRIEVLLILIALAIAAGWFVGVAPTQRELDRISTCSAHLRGLSGGFYIYAGENGDRFPSLFDGTRAGEMAPFAYRSKPPMPNDIPSPTADLWTMMSQYYSSPQHMICPSTTDTPDPFQYGDTAFDFAGPNHLSYAYVYQYHPTRRPLGTASHEIIPIIADANPYLKGGVQTSVTTHRNGAGRGNTLNHRAGKGQNALFVHGGTQFLKTPVIGPSPGRAPYFPPHPADNIYTIHADGEPSDPGNAPTWTRIQIGSKSDYCLVP